ncbi:antibiotic biosynthesis monooxygenase [Rhizobium rhizogenes]|uniref:Antibiotic biosynthesis monooxygenase n=1 Tax=Rhizobium rhizogenes TaxID=359 RepID=A0AA92H7I8_RHIRH|nr:antibiotic biosynthesis monooxygenase [Rhizobium rhizogenes]PVE50676.1 antibiotic biosynthesis monooxygenase [Rhizobium rhizogenes]PVE62323.1 antibiotic biosynthesis monooxygenase [Agrobacterium tumefaciens]PVE70506.1 antibiotic biosynthesis monooxygenase [Sphingomonas sp. TPD3009]
MSPVVEVAEIRVTDPAGFEAAVAAARPYFLAAEGCLDLALHRVIETPDTYRLLVNWRSVEDHIVTFRASEGFEKWRALASPYFVAPPSVTHSAAVAL